MPNFDRFERIFKSVMTSELSSEEGAMQIINLPEVEKVNVVKARSEAEVKEFLNRAKSKLIAFFPHKPKFSSSDNNRLGKDLLEENSNISVELKSGSAMTDANVGLKSVEWAIGDANGDLSKLVSNSVKERQLLLSNNSPLSEIEASKDKEMDDVYELFCVLLDIGPAPDRLSHFVRCISLGLTKGLEIQSTFNSVELQNTPLMLQADWEEGLQEYEKTFEDNEVIEIINIERTEKRVQIVLRGVSSGRIARIYPHHRNSWKDPKGKKHGATNWATTGSCQIWIS
jgi:hypothetical protein